MKGKTTLPILTLGPFSLLPKFQRQGYGKALLDYSLAEVGKMGYKAVFLEGNINFYGKSGFRPASDFHIYNHFLPIGEPSPYFLCKELKEAFLTNVSGTYFPPKGYFIDETKVDDFDKRFPPKVKLKLPGQLD